jgi:acyl-CoA thioesterase
MTNDAEKDDLARRCANTMWSDDRATSTLGIELLDVAAGTAVLAMFVTPAMVNGHGICHGGYIFLLADSAFAFACNTYDHRTVAQHCAITFARPAKLGERLIATARERMREARSGIYDVTITASDGVVVAEFRGNSRTIAGRILDDTRAP